MTLRVNANALILKRKLQIMTDHDVSQKPMDTGFDMVGVVGSSPIAPTNTIRRQVLVRQGLGGVLLGGRIGPLLDRQGRAGRDCVPAHDKRGRRWII
jgi:hypothetical protein